MKTTARSQSSNLTEISAGTTARVVTVTGDTPIARRLLEMGVVPGAPVRVVKAAPFGDPLEICVRNSHLAVRRNEASSILVTSDE